MLNLFRRPIETETVDAWAKWLEDLAKVAVVALPVVIFGQYSVEFKIINSLLLAFSTYSFMLIAKLIRKYKQQLSEEN